MKTPNPDRRSHERYDVIGSLWGLLELPASATIVNVSRGGLLIESAVCVAPNAVHPIDMLVDGEPARVNAVVRHCHGCNSGGYRIGLEFVDVPGTVVSSVEQLGSNAGSDQGD
jgi:hypothetical protein